MQLSHQNMKNPSGKRLFAMLPLLFYSILTCKAEEFMRRDGYAFSDKMVGRMENCTLGLQECDNQCLSNKTCSAIGFEGNQMLSEIARVTNYGRIFLKSKQTATVWVKSMRLISKIWILNLKNFFEVRNCAILCFPLLAL